MEISSQSLLLQIAVEEVLQRVRERPTMNTGTEREQIAKNLWRLFKEVERRGGSRSDVVSDAGLGAEGDSTKRLDTYVLNPEASGERKRAKVERLAKKVEKYVRFVPTLASALNEDSGALLMQLVRGTAYQTSGLPDMSSGRDEPLINLLNALTTMGDWVLSRHDLRNYFRTIEERRLFTRDQGRAIEVRAKHDYEGGEEFNIYDGIGLEDIPIIPIMTGGLYGAPVEAYPVGHLNDREKRLIFAIVGEIYFALVPDPGTGDVLPVLLERATARFYTPKLISTSGENVYSDRGNIQDGLPEVYADGFDFPPESPAFDCPDLGYLDDQTKLAIQSTQPACFEPHAKPHSLLAFKDMKRILDFEMMTETPTWYDPEPTGLTNAIVYLEYFNEPTVYRPNTLGSILESHFISVPDASRLDHILDKEVGGKIAALEIHLRNIGERSRTKLKELVAFWGQV